MEPVDHIMKITYQDIMYQLKIGRLIIILLSLHQIVANKITNQHDIQRRHEFQKIPVSMRLPR